MRTIYSFFLLIMSIGCSAPALITLIYVTQIARSKHMALVQNRRLCHAVEIRQR